MSNWSLFVKNPISDVEKSISGTLISSCYSTCTVKATVTGLPKPFTATKDINALYDNGKTAQQIADAGEFTITGDDEFLPQGGPTSGPGSSEYAYNNILTRLSSIIDDIYGTTIGSRLVWEKVEEPKDNLTSSDIDSIHNEDKNRATETDNGIQSVEKLDSIFTFNVEKESLFIIVSTGTFSTSSAPSGIATEIGELMIVDDSELFTFQDDPYEDYISDEYSETEFLGVEESTEKYVGEEMDSNTSANVNQSEGNTSLSSSGTSEHLKPTLEGFLQGDSFTKTITGGGGWKTSVDPTYRLTGFKYGKSNITLNKWIQWKKEAEGGIANGTTDSAFRTYGNDTVVPISMKKSEYKKYDNICTTSSGKRLYNIHTNKGILWMVFKKQFGTSVEVQKRFLSMSDDDWWEIMKKRFYDKNRADEINSLVCRLMWISWCWGSGTGGAIRNLNNCLNLLAGQDRFKSQGGITTDHINFMNSLDENILISAMYDIRVQFFLNISQPGNTNAVYRNGWINAMNKWISRFHDKSIA